MKSFKLNGYTFWSLPTQLKVKSTLSAPNDKQRCGEVLPISFYLASRQEFEITTLEGLNGVKRVA